MLLIVSLSYAQVPTANLVGKLLAQIPFYQKQLVSG